MKILNKKFATHTLFMLVIVFMLFLTACGSTSNQNGNNHNGAQATNANQPSSEETDTASNASANEQEDVQEEEEGSNTLVVYSAGPGSMAAAIKEGFEKKTGIKVEEFDGTTGKVLARLEAEKNNTIADVVVLASWPAGLSLKAQGMTQSYEDAANRDKLYPTWIDEESHLFGYSASALGMTYNTKLVSTPPTDWDDFTNPEWKDAVNIPDPSLSGSALDFISGYLNEKGDAGWELFENLKENGVEMAGANKAALEPVITGAKSAVMAGVDYMAYSAIASGEPIGIAYPESGTVINPRPAMIMKDAKNVENARKFIDYLLSEEAQQIVADAYLLPGRSDVPAHEDRTQVSEIKLLQYDWDWMSEQGTDITTKFLDLYK